VSASIKIKRSTDIGSIAGNNYRKYVATLSCPETGKPIKGFGDACRKLKPGSKLCR
jgi:hypothetical protein